MSTTNHTTPISIDAPVHENQWRFDLYFMARAGLERAFGDYLIHSELVSKAKAMASSWEFVEFCDELALDFVDTAAAHLAEFIAEKQGPAA